MHLCAALALACVAVFAGPAFAQPADGAIVVPYGEWIAAVGDFAVAVLLAGGLWLIRRVPSHFVDMIDSAARAFGQGSMNELLEKAVQFGVNATAGAVRDKTLTVHVGNEVLERAAEYALRHAPGLVAKYGGLGPLREKIIARLNLDEGAAVPAPRPAVEALIAPAPAPAAAPAAS